VVYTRRNVIAMSGAALASAVLPKVATAQSFEFKPNQRYPDPAIEILDPSFAKYRLFSSSVEQLATGNRWLEGPVWFGDGRYLLVSDVPNNRIMRYDEATGVWGVFRSPSNFSNGNARDLQGRLITCEHLTRRVTRTEHDGEITVLADNYVDVRSVVRLGKMPPLPAIGFIHGTWCSVAEEEPPVHQAAWKHLLAVAAGAIGAAAIGSMAR
jgi:gluconolactonase